jgi:hypothetical protein
MPRSSLKLEYTHLDQRALELRANYSRIVPGRGAQCAGSPIRAIRHAGHPWGRSAGGWLQWENR